MSTGVGLLEAPEGQREDWIELDAVDEGQAAHGKIATGLIERWVTIDPVDELLGEIHARSVPLSSAQIQAISDVVAGWRPESEVLGNLDVQEGIRQTIRDIEDWKNSL